MTMMICEDCGYTADSRDIGTRESYLCTIDGKSYYEEIPNSCPECKGEFVPAVECKICGAYHKSEEFWYGVCDKCLENKATVENAIELGNDDKEKIEINGFLLTVFKESEIQEILMREAEKKNIAELAKKYCLNDKTAFTEFVIYKY